MAWLSGWNYRKLIAVTGQAGAGSDYQVRLEVHTGSGVDSAGVVYLLGHCADFPDDIRFVDSDEVTLLESWIEPGSGSPRVFWIKVDDDLDSNQSFYVYYGRRNSSIAGLFNDEHVWSGLETWTDEQKDLASNLIDDFGSIDWGRHASNPLLSKGAPASWDDKQVQGLILLRDDSEIKMYYGGVNAAGVGQIGLATSPLDDGINWTKEATNPVITVGAPAAWDDEAVGPGGVIKDGATYKMWYHGYDGTTYKIGLATSPDGIVWTKEVTNPVLSPDGVAWDETWVGKCQVIKEGATYKMWYVGYGGTPTVPQIGYATSNNGIDWNKHGGNPVLSPGGGGEWDDAAAEILDVVRIADKYVMFYEGSHDYGDLLGVQFKLGVASSANGTAWTKHPNNPIFSWGSTGSWDDFHILHPGILWMPSAEKFYLYYAGTDGTTWPTVAQIGVAVEGPRSEGYATFLEFACFDDGSIDDFTPVVDGGAWDNPDNYLRSINAGGVDHLAYKGASRSDYAVAVKIRTPTGGTLREMCLLARHNGSVGVPLIAYRFAIRTTILWDLRYKLAGAGWVLLDSGAGVYALDTWYLLELLVDGTAIKAKIDEAQVSAVVDAHVAAAGYGALYSYYNEFRHWDEFRIRKYNDPEPVVGTAGAEETSLILLRAPAYGLDPMIF